MLLRGHFISSVVWRAFLSPDRAFDLTHHKLCTQHRMYTYTESYPHWPYNFSLWHTHSHRHINMHRGEGFIVNGQQVEVLM